ncbi:hypothetical protein E2C01_045042 [Portunus trituberculatus]|uniref:Uncharacterized protein n=1 Tax=Portunus trituberculatus TaxID=210409 RepID=A0A5B7FUP0_PORTR|nr:hypothetical protein [Portunus trituberculatus]
MIADGDGNNSAMIGFRIAGSHKDESVNGTRVAAPCEASLATTGNRRLSRCPAVRHLGRTWGRDADSGMSIGMTSTRIFIVGSFPIEDRRRSGVWNYAMDGDERLRENALERGWEGGRGRDVIASGEEAGRRGR